MSSTYPYPRNRSKHLIESKSTDAQQATEHECAPFFVDLKSLTEHQLDHLRSVGLLPPPLAAVENRSTTQMLSTKAAKLLGVDSADDAGLRSVELLEEVVHPSFSGNIDVCEDDEDQYAVRLVKHKHINYLCNALSEPLSRGFISLDASHPWMVYWCLHSLDLMHYFDPSDTSSSSAAIHDVETLQKSQLLKRIVSTLKHCWTNASLQFDVDEVRNNENYRWRIRRRTSTNASLCTDVCCSVGAVYHCQYWQWDAAPRGV
jgi:hypothetical protein